MLRSIAWAWGGVVVAALGLGASGVRAQQPLPPAPDSSRGVQRAAPDSSRGALPPAPDSRGVLRPGDVVQLDIWREKDLTGRFDVDEHGDAVLPKIGRVQVAGVEPDSLKAQIVREYERYLRNPSINVTFLRRVTILGSVTKPGVYPVDPTMTIADALALAGGASPEGQHNRLQLYRGGTLVDTRLSLGTRIADTPIRSGDQLFVPERPWLSRNSPLVATAITSVITLLIAFRTFR